MLLVCTRDTVSTRKLSAACPSHNQASQLHVCLRVPPRYRGTILLNSTNRQALAVLQGGFLNSLKGFSESVSASGSLCCTARTATECPGFHSHRFYSSTVTHRTHCWFILGKCWGLKESPGISLFRSCAGCTRGWPHREEEQAGA